MFRKAPLVCLLLSCLAPGAAAQPAPVVRELSLPAGGAEALHVQTRSGYLLLRGTDGDSVEAEMLIDFDSSWSEDEARELIDQGLVFSLEEDGDELRLESWIDFEALEERGLLRAWRERGSQPDIQLRVSLPARLDLSVEDGSGDVLVSDLEGDVLLHDGSGSVEARALRGDLEIHDGSGDLDLTDVGGAVRIQDGSGSILLREVGGRVFIADGSGDIQVRDARDTVEIHDGSGGIDVASVAGDLILRDGSGRVSTRDIRGELRRND